MTRVVLPFSLWTCQGPETQFLSQAKLPHWRAWLARAQRTQVLRDAEPSDGRLATFTPPHERVLAQAQGWVEQQGGDGCADADVRDGCLPWAALAAAETGGDGSLPWAFISLCHWHVSNGQVTLMDPAALRLDAATDQALFQAMQVFFAEDGIVLHPYRTGLWLAQSALFAQLPTASLDRVIGRNIDPWLVEQRVLRRLQNEMQMLLYNHPVNDGRALPINSFWVHGAGALPHAGASAGNTLTRRASQVPDADCVAALRTAALQQDLMAWLAAWEAVDAQVIQPLLASAQPPTEWVLCGEQEAHVYRAGAPSWWQRLRHGFQPLAMQDVIGVRS